METQHSIASSMEAYDGVIIVRTNEAGDFVAQNVPKAGDLVPYQRVPARKDGNCFFQSILGAVSGKPISSIKHIHAARRKVCNVIRDYDLSGRELFEQNRLVKALYYPDVDEIPKGEAVCRWRVYNKTDRRAVYQAVKIDDFNLLLGTGEAVDTTAAYAKYLSITGHPESDDYVAASLSYNPERCFYTTFQMNAVYADDLIIKYTPWAFTVSPW